MTELRCEREDLFDHIFKTSGFEHFTKEILTPVPTKMEVQKLNKADRVNRTPGLEFLDTKDKELWRKEDSRGVRLVEPKMVNEVIDSTRIGLQKLELFFVHVVH